jgi:poly-gamma-glutamate synthesis protein (capsule biosynthesis protein)
MRRSAFAFLIVFAPFVVLAVLYELTTTPIDTNRPLEIPANGPLTVALAGDVLFTGQLGTMERDQTFIAVRSALGSANFALANLDMNLLGPEEAAQADARPQPRWPFGVERDALVLKQLGFDLLALANDHGGDYGPDAVRSTRRVLDRVGLLHAGTGADLAEARAPASAGRIAVVAVAASSFPEARATATRGDIAGRPGVSPLRYAAERTSVQFAVNEEDQRDVLESITRLRATADVVIVSLHAHEPSNASDAPAPFVEQFARAAIDAGASIVFGHGPHRLRGIEMYKNGAIVFGLGNFLYRAERLDFRAANMFDAGADLFQAAIGAPGGSLPIRATPPDEPAWWESVLAIATLEAGRVTGLQVIPLDLGADKSIQSRGIPRVALGSAAERIRGRVADLSLKRGTALAFDPESGQLVVGRPAR